MMFGLETKLYAIPIIGIIAGFYFNFWYLLIVCFLLVIIVYLLSSLDLKEVKDCVRSVSDFTSPGEGTMTIINKKDYDLIRIEPGILDSKYVLIPLSGKILKHYNVKTSLNSSDITGETFEIKGTIPYKMVIKPSINELLGILDAYEIYHKPEYNRNEKLMFSPFGLTIMIYLPKGIVDSNLKKVKPGQIIGHIGTEDVNSSIIFD